MIVIRRLPADKYERLKRIFREEFDSDLPEPENSEIFVAIDDGKLAGFVLAEDIKMVGQIYAAPAYRDRSLEVVMPLIREIRDNYEGNAVVGTLASEPRFGKLYASLGMEPIAGDFWRRNIAKKRL